MKIETITSLKWEDFLRTSKERTVFHHYDWYTFTAEQFGAEFIALHVYDNKNHWLVPCFRGLPWNNNTHTVGISTIGYGGPLRINTRESVAHNAYEIKELLSEVAKYFNADHITGTLYPSTFWPPQRIKDFEYSETCCLAINEDLDHLFDNVISGNARTAIRKSRSNMVEVVEINRRNKAQLELSLNLLQTTQNKVGSNYTTTDKYYNALANFYSEFMQVKIFLAYFDEQMTAMSVAVHDDQELFHLFHGWERSNSHVCANQALIWHMICYGANSGVKLFNMGESHSPTLLKAKLRWGGDTKKVPKINLYI